MVGRDGAVGHRIAGLDGLATVDSPSAGFSHAVAVGVRHKSAGGRRDGFPELPMASVATRRVDVGGGVRMDCANTVGVDVNQ